MAETWQDPTNEDRAKRIDALIEEYARTKGEVPEPDSDIADILTDIMHYCDREKIDFDAELSRATDNYSAEREDGNEP